MTTLATHYYDAFDAACTLSVEENLKRIAELGVDPSCFEDYHPGAVAAARARLETLPLVLDCTDEQQVEDYYEAIIH